MKKILNRISIFFVLCLIMITTSGCAKINNTIVIDRAGNAVMTETSVFANDIYYLVSDGINATIKEAESSDCEAEKIEIDGMRGVKIQKKFENLADNDLSFKNFILKDNLKNNNGRFVQVTKNFFSTEYLFDIKIDVGENAGVGEIKLSIQPPVKAKSHNANSVNDETHLYTWLLDSSDTIELKYSVLNVFNIALCVVISLIILGALSALFLYLNKSKAANNIPCSKCGKEIKSGAKKCKHCGEWLIQERKEDN